MSDEMERVAEGMWGGRRFLSPLRWPEQGLGWSPSVEMFEKDKQLVVRAELPGLAKDDIKVELSDHTLLPSASAVGGRCFWPLSKKNVTVCRSRHWLAFRTVKWRGT